MFETTNRPLVLMENWDIPWGWNWDNGDFSWDDYWNLCTLVTWHWGTAHKEAFMKEVFPFSTG